jgi:hypothetical protein
VNRYVKIFVKISVGDDIDAALLRSEVYYSLETSQRLISSQTREMEINRDQKKSTRQIQSLFSCL